MERIGNEVERALGRAGGGAGRALAAISAAWPDAVGPAIARNAWPLRMSRDGTLHVATASATWAFELDRMSAEIFARLADALGERAPTGLRFRVGPVPESGSRADESVGKAQKLVRDVAPEVASAADAAAAAIDDPALRELVARAARASLGGGASGRRF